MDQIAAGVLGQDTQLASLELSLESSEPVGACDPGYSCAYTNTLCWRSATTPLPMENDPRVVFERLFGASQSTDPAVWRARREQDRSILDAVRTKANRLRRTSDRPIAPSWISISTRSAIWSGGSRGESSRRRGSCRRSTSRPAYRGRSKSTRS